MAVKIRLKRMGKIRTPFYRVVVADSRTKRDGRVIEEIGTYNPKAEPSVIHIESERAQYWLGVGAQPSEAVTALLRLTGDWETFTGEKQTQTLKVADPARDKAEIFNEALKEIHGDGAGRASLDKADAPAKKTAKKTEKKAEKPAEAKADDEPAADEPAKAGSAEAESTDEKPADESGAS